jgi:preprotein translocase subunit SecY
VLQAFAAAFRTPDLRRKLLFSLAIIAVYRLGAAVPGPGVSIEAINSCLEQAQASDQRDVYSLVNLFSGGALLRLSVFALGIMPYITASIIVQLLVVVIPRFEQLKKEGQSGQAKLTQYTRYLTIALAVLQSTGIIALARSGQLFPNCAEEIIPSTSVWTTVVLVVALTAGTALIMWLGEQISEKGIGNGISLIIFAGIVVRLPSAISASYTLITTGELKLFVFLAIILIMVGVTAAVVLMQEGQRKIPVQYAKRVVGRRVYGGQSTHIPLRINTAGVIPVIFASSLILFPATLARFLPGFMQSVADALSPGQVTYTVLYMGLIVFFAYFYTAIVFNPVDLADNMKKYGGFIPGVRPGKKTAEYIDHVLTRITLPGALFLALISVLPDLLIRWFNVPFYFGGTSLLIVVGVALDTVRQMESHLLMRNYEGFLKRSKSRSGAFARRS